MAPKHIANWCPTANGQEVGARIHTVKEQGEERGSLKSKPLACAEDDDHNLVAPELESPFLAQGPLLAMGK